MNPIYTFIQKLPTNGYTTAIGAIAAICFGISGIVTGKLDVMTGWVSISAGIAALGLGNKLAKVTAAVEDAKALLTPTQP